jgi:hypothetical protein
VQDEEQGNAKQVGLEDRRGLLPQKLASVGGDKAKPDVP